MAVSEYYVDPQSGNDTTGDGTSGTPWKTVQKALDTITRNSTDGDRINVKAGAADTLSAALSYATYGTPTAAAMLTIRGYTTSAGDGGIGEISGAGSYGISGSAWTNVNFIDMKIGNCGSVDVLDFGPGANAINCEIHTSSGFGVDCGTGTVVLGCWLHDLTGTQAIDSTTDCRVLYCFIDCAVTTVVIDGTQGSVIIGNIIDLSGADTNVDAIQVTTYSTVLNNTIYCSQANTGVGISITGVGAPILNNVIEGWSGSGGDGIETTVYTFVGANAAYNCAAAFTLTSAKLNHAIAANDTLGASPFVNAGSADFDINGTQTGVTEDAYPVGGFKGNSSVANKADKGAVQAGAGTGSTGGGPVFGGMVVR